MPEFVEDYFMAAAQRASLRVERKANPRLLRVEHVPQALRAAGLHALRSHGAPSRSYNKLTFHKTERSREGNYDAELISPGHPLYAVTDEVAQRTLRPAAGGTARYLDATTSDPYRLHFFEFELEGDSLGDPSQPPRSVAAHAELVAVREEPDGTLTLSQPDILHDLTPAPSLSPPAGPWTAPVTSNELRRITDWVRARVQFPRRQNLHGHRQKEVAVRRDFLTRSFRASLRVAEDRVQEMNARVFKDGQSDSRFARDEAERRLDELKAQQAHRERALDFLGTVRNGRIQHLGSAVVATAPVAEASWMRRDDVVEAFAMEYATRAEQARGFVVEDVSRKRDGSGFDLRSVGPRGADGAQEVRRIEVKGRAESSGPVQLTPNEWRQAQRLRQTYWLYVVWGCKTDAPRLRMIQDPAVTLADDAREIRVVKGIWIDDDKIKAANGQEWSG
jgi:hypothetical protein